MSIALQGRTDPTGNYFPVPNDVFSLGLETGELAVYGYLLRCEDRETHQCWPSYRTIGKAIRMSPNTVRKYVAGLVEKQLIATEPTTVMTKSGLKRNGNLLYTIQPIQEAVDRFHERQMVLLEQESERQRAAKKLADYERVSPQEPLCATLPGAAGADPGGTAARR